MPFIFGTVARSNKYFSREVENAMKQLAAEDPNMHLIDMSGAELLNDRLHFYGSFGRVFGDNRYISSWNKLLKELSSGLMN